MVKRVSLFYNFYFLNEKYTKIVIKEKSNVLKKLIYTIYDKKRTFSCKLMMIKIFKSMKEILISLNLQHNFFEFSKIYIMKYFFTKYNEHFRFFKILLKKNIRRRSLVFINFIRCNIIRIIKKNLENLNNILYSL